VRAIQQNRKDADLKITDRINLEISSTNSRITEVAKSFEDYIKEQVLANKIEYISSADTSSTKTIFKNNLEDGELLIVLSTH
jgi:valyl-tRNA synthetase